MASKMKKHRGIGLSVWLIFLALMNIISLVLIIGTARGPDAITYPYLVAGLFVFSAAKFVAFIAIWFWERWGLYVLAFAVIGTMAIGIILTASVWYAFNEILPIAILGWMLRDKYDNFD